MLHRFDLPLFALGSDSACSLNVRACCVIVLLALDLSRGSVSAFFNNSGSMLAGRAERGKSVKDVSRRGLGKLVKDVMVQR